MLQRQVLRVVRTVPPTLPCEGHRDEPGRVCSLHLHQHAMIARGLGLDQRRANIADGRDRLAADIEDDVSCFYAVLRSRTARID